MSDTNVIHFGVDPQLAALRGKLLMSFGCQVHLCSSLTELEYTLKKRRIQCCIVCQTVPDVLSQSAANLLALHRIPALVLSAKADCMTVLPGVVVSSPSAREFLPKLKAIVPGL
jgi:hypothetical protein